MNTIISFEKFHYFLFIFLLLSNLVAGNRCRKNSDCHTRWCEGGQAWPGSRGYCKSKRHDHHWAHNGDSNSCISGREHCGICGHGMNNGHKCSSNAYCNSGWCDGTVTWNCGGTCRSKVADGGNAHTVVSGVKWDYNICSSGRGQCGYCGASNRNGLKCGTNSDCSSGWCEGTFTSTCGGVCKSKVPDGGSAYQSSALIWDYNSCSSGRGQCGYCGASNRNGLKCGEDSDCSSGYCEGASTAGCSSVCVNKLHDNAECPQRPVTRDGTDNACKSGECMAFLKIRKWETIAYCRPHGGFLEGGSCTQDSDCSDAGQGLWCKGGAYNKMGVCTLCPDTCVGGCHACDNDVERMSCGRSSTLDKFACGTEVAATKAVEFFECMVGDLSCALELIDEAKDCIQGIDCIFEIEECLMFNQAYELELSKSYGDLNLDVTGTMDVNIGLELVLDPNDWTFKVTFVANVTSGLNLNLNSAAELEKAVRKSLGRKKTIMKKVIMVGNVPVLLELDMEPRLWADLLVEAQMEANMEITSNVAYTQSVTLDIQNMKLLQDSNEFDDDKVFQIEDLSVTGTFDAQGVIRVGPRIQLSVYNIPITLDIAGRLAVDVNIGAQASTDLKTGAEACLSGSIGMSAGLDVRFSALFTSLNPIDFAKEMCNEAGMLMLDTMNPLNVMVDKAQCFTDVADIDTSAVDDMQEDVMDTMSNLIESICDGVIDSIVPDEVEKFLCEVTEGANALQSDWATIASFDPKFSFELCPGSKTSVDLESTISTLADISSCGEDGEAQGNEPESEEYEEGDNLFTTVWSYNPIKKGAVCGNGHWILCKNKRHLAIQGTCNGADSSGWLPNSCNIDCVKKRCDNDPLCVGFTEDTSASKKRYQMVAELFSTRNQAGRNCYAKRKYKGDIYVSSNEGYCEGTSIGDYRDETCDYSCAQTACEADTNCKGITQNGNRYKLMRSVYKIGGLSDKNEINKDDSAWPERVQKTDCDVSPNGGGVYGCGGAHYGGTINGQLCKGEHPNYPPFLWYKTCCDYNTKENTCTPKTEPQYKCFLKF